MYTRLSLNGNNVCMIFLCSLTPSLGSCIKFNRHNIVYFMNVCVLVSVCITLVK